MTSYLFVSLLIFILLAGVDGFLAVVLLVIAFLYIFVGIFSRVSENEKIFRYTSYYFRVFNIIQFVLLLITNILNVPFLANNE